MKLPKIPEPGAEPKTPKSLWDTIITSTPVIMTVLATLLAGLSNSELTQSLVFRAQAAQNQSKAGDQWSFFQAKKLRSANASTAVEQMQSGGDLSALSADAFIAAAQHLAAKIDAISSTKLPPATAAELKSRIGPLSADVKHAIDALSLPPPPISETNIADANVRRAYEAVKKDPMDAESSATYAAFTGQAVQTALRVADQNSRSDDQALKPMSDAFKTLQKSLDDLASAAGDLRRATTQAALPAPSLGASDRQSPADLRQLAADLSAARLRFDALRYEREARLNQQVAYLYEVAVRKAAWQSDRYRTRSKYFFYGMLAAQAAVMIATFSLAVRERSWMWSIAASIGVFAISYAGYVYLFT